jgi:endoglucanase
MPMDSVDLLRRLTEAFGPSGFEDEVREVVQQLVTPLVDEVRVDALGNLIAVKRGASDKTLMIDAHLDEIGFMVTWVEPDGFLRFTNLGGWDARIVPSHVITIRSDHGNFVRGVVGTAPPHVLRPEDRERPFRLDDLFIDIGATNADEVADLGIRIGSPAVIHTNFERLHGDWVLAKALDDRAGCAVLVKTLENLKDEQLDVTLAASFTVAEEVGLHGATTAAYQIEPDFAVALEGSMAVDIPGIPSSRSPMRAGQGPSVRVLTHGQVVKSEMVSAMVAVARQEGIPFQYQVPVGGGTNADVIHISRAGVLAGVISVPCRHIHSPHSMTRLEDFENTVRLTTAFARHGRGALGV